MLRKYYQYIRKFAASSSCWAFDVSIVIWQIGNLRLNAWIWKVWGSTTLWQGSRETFFHWIEKSIIDFGQRNHTGWWSAAVLYYFYVRNSKKAINCKTKPFLGFSEMKLSGTSSLKSSSKNNITRLIENWKTFKSLWSPSEAEDTVLVSV